MPDAVAELRAMPPAARRDILRALAPEERKLVQTLLIDTNAPAPVALTEAPNGHSPWLAGLIDQAGRAGGGTGRLTLAVRQHLARSVTPASAPRVSGRSLLDAVGGLGMGRKRPA